MPSRPLAAASLLGLALAAPAALSAEQATPKNLLFILAEDMGPQLSHPALARWGGAQVQTPHIDALADRGVLFRHAHVTTPVSSASRTTVLTGLHNHANRIRGNTQNYFWPMTKEESDAITDPVYRQASVPEHYATLIEILRDAGYHTGVSQKLHSSPNHKFPYDDWIVPVNANTVQTVVSNAQAAGKPWMLMYGPQQAHAPFAQAIMPNIDLAGMELPSTLPDSPASRNMWARYLSEIQRVDASVGQAMAKLEELDQLDNTIIVFMGDHGTGIPGAKTTPYDFGTRTPLMIAGPGIRQGVVSDALASTVDLMPTLLDLMGLPTPAQSQGVSHAGYLIGSDDGPRRANVVSEVFGANIGEALMRERSITDGEWRLVQRWRINSPRMLNIDMFKVGYGGDPTNGDTYREIVDARVTEPERYRWLARMHSTRFKAVNPMFELYRTGEDTWEQFDRMDDRSLDPVINRLQTQLRVWALQTGDPDTSLRTGPQSQIVQDAFDPIPVMNEDDAAYPQQQYVKLTVHTGPLDLDPDWTTRSFGNNGADFRLEDGVLKAPPGPLALATHAAPRLQARQAFRAEVDTMFEGAGVAGGIVFGYTDPDNWLAFQLMDGDTAAGGADKDLRLIRMADGQQQTQLFINHLPNAPRNEWHRLRVDYDPVSASAALRVTGPGGGTYYEGVVELGAPLPAYSQFGVSTWSSASSRFNDFRVELHAAEVLPGDFNGDGVLDAADLVLLEAAIGQPASDHPGMNLVLPDDTITDEDARYWREVLYPAVTGEEFTAPGNKWVM